MKKTIYFFWEAMAKKNRYIKPMLEIYQKGWSWKQSRIGIQLLKIMRSIHASQVTIIVLKKKTFWLKNACSNCSGETWSNLFTPPIFFGKNQTSRCLERPSSLASKSAEVNVMVALVASKDGWGATWRKYDKWAVKRKTGSLDYLGSYK